MLLLSLDLYLYDNLLKNCFTDCNSEINCVAEDKTSPESSHEQIIFFSAVPP
jgi:hypothetical protein